MASLNHVRMLWKLLGGFGAVSLLMVAIGLLGTTTADRINSSLNHVGVQLLPATVALEQTQTNLLLGQRSIRTAILADDPKAIHDALVAGRQALADSRTALASYEAQPLSEQETQLAAPLDDALKSYTGFFEQAAVAAVANIPTSKAQASDLILNQAAAADMTLNTNLPRLAALNEQAATDAMHDSQSLFDQSLRMLIAAMVAGVLLALGIGLV